MGVSQLCSVFEDAREHLTLLMQLLTLEPELAAYNMKLMTTKCLNTAVMTMTLYLGMMSALPHTRYCDVQHVKARHKRQPNRGSTSGSALMRSVLRASPLNKRYLHYVMLTDGDLTLPDGRGEVYFPGHVFVIEHGVDGYKLYQSYVERYDLNQHICHRGGSLRLDRAQMQLVMEAVKRFVAAPTWTEQSSRDFALLTHVEPDVFQGAFGGARNDDAILLCHRTVEFKGGCTNALLAYVERKQAEMDTLGGVAGDIYGDPSMYAAGTSPLTRAQVSAGLADLRARLLGNNQSK